MAPTAWKLSPMTNRSSRISGTWLVEVSAAKPTTANAVVEIASFRLESQVEANSGF